MYKSLMAALLLCCGTQAFANELSKTQKVLDITGNDPDRKVFLEKSVAIIHEDENGEFGALQILSEKGTIDQTYTYDQLIQMHGAPIQYSGFTIMYIDTRDFTKDGGVLIIKYVKNIMAFKKEYGLAEFEISKDRSLDQWFVHVNDQAGRREVTKMHLVLNAGNMFGQRVPVGVRYIEFNRRSLR